MFQHKTAIITGSTRGIGLAIAKALSALGCQIVITSRQSTTAGTTAAQQLPKAIYVQADLTKDKDCQRLIDSTIKQFGQLDIIVNNAAFSVRIPHHDIAAISATLFKKILDHNVVSAWRLCQCALPFLQASPDASILMISSVAGIRPIGSSIAYAVSKAALNHLTLLLAKTLAPGIRVNAIAPGFIETERTQDWHDIKQQMLDKTPLKRSGKPQEIADLACALLHNCLITGSIVVADGGFNLA